MSNVIRFVCPKCNASHDRGFVDGESLFRCLGCGYLGHGFHPDRVIDRLIFEDHKNANAINRSLGIPEVPLGDDPLSHGR